MKLFVALSALFVLVPQAFAVSYLGSIYEEGSNKQKLIYRVKRDEVLNSDLSKIVFSDLLGKEVVSEELILEHSKISKYLVHHKQLGEERSMEVKEGKIYFQVTREGQVSKDDEKLTDNLVVGPTIVDYLKKNWSLLLSGKEVEVRYAALERKETVGFKFFVDEEKKVDGKSIIVVKMKPTSFIIAALVKPLLFTFEKDTGKLLELKGRTLPKQNVNGSWKDLDAEVVYSYTP